MLGKQGSKRTVNLSRSPSWRGCTARALKLKPGQEALSCYLYIARTVLGRISPPGACM